MTTELSENISSNEIQPFVVECSLNFEYDGLCGQYSGWYRRTKCSFYNTDPETNDEGFMIKANGLTMMRLEHYEPISIFSLEQIGSFLREYIINHSTNSWFDCETQANANVADAVCEIIRACDTNGLDYLKNWNLDDQDCD